MHPPALNLPVPSRSLLRFLRAQSEALVAESYGAPRALCRARPRPVPNHFCLGTKRSVRVLCTTTLRREAPLQAGVLDVKKIFRKLHTAQSRQGKKDSTLWQSQSDVTPDNLHTDGVAWHEKLWGSRGGEGGDERPPDDDATDTFFRRQVSSTKAKESKIRVTELDENGQVILVDGDFAKTELIAKYGLLPRDLRKIDSSNLPHILVRPSAILLNLLHLRVLIKYNRVLLFDVYGSTPSHSQSRFMYDLENRLRQKQPSGPGGLPYEFRALEAVLVSVTTELEAELDAVRQPIIRVLSELEDDITRDKLRVLLVLLKKVSTFEQKAKLVAAAIDELLEADDDLVNMYLTEKTHDLMRGEDDHAEIELLLESYYKICDEVVQESSNLVMSIRSTEEITRAILDANRNALMLLDLKFSVGTLGLAMGTFLAGLYGMNLENFIEDTNWGFGTVTGLSTIFSLIVCWYGLTRLRRVQRVKMHNSDSKRRHDHWFQEESASALLQARNREAMERFYNSKLKQLEATKKKGWF